MVDILAFCSFTKLLKRKTYRAFLIKEFPSNHNTSYIIKNIYLRQCLVRFLFSHNISNRMIYSLSLILIQLRKFCLSQAYIFLPFVLPTFTYLHLIIHNMIKQRFFPSFNINIYSFNMNIVNRLNLM